MRLALLFAGLFFFILAAIVGYGFIDQWADSWDGMVATGLALWLGAISIPVASEVTRRG